MISRQNLTFIMTYIVFYVVVNGLLCLAYTNVGTVFKLLIIYFATIFTILFVRDFKHIIDVPNMPQIIIGDIDRNIG